jgi:hypothetical protein
MPGGWVPGDWVPRGWVLGDWMPGDWVPGDWVHGSGAVWGVCGHLITSRMDEKRPAYPSIVSNP